MHTQYFKDYSSSLDRNMECQVYGHAGQPVLYMDYGAREMNNHELMAEQFARVTGQLLARGIKLTCRIVPNGDHCEACWQRQIPFFINTLLYDI